MFWLSGVCKCIPSDVCFATMRQLKGKVKENKKEKRERKKENIESKKMALTFAIPALVVIAMIVGLIVYAGTRPKL